MHREAWKYGSNAVQFNVPGELTLTMCVADVMMCVDDVRSQTSCQPHHCGLHVKPRSVRRPKAQIIIIMRSVRLSTMPLVSGGKLVLCLFRGTLGHQCPLLCREIPPDAVPESPCCRRLPVSREAATPPAVLSLS